MKRVLKIFFQAPDTNPWLVLVCLLIAGICEAVSLSALLPIAAQIGGESDDTTSPLNHYVNEILTAIGITPTLGALLIIVVLAVVLKNLMSFAALSYAGYALARVSTSLRRQLLSAMFEARWSYFVNQRTGRIANAISNDATRAGDCYFFSARFVANCIQAVVYAGVALMLSLKLAIAGTIVGAGVVFLLKGLVYASRRAGYKQTDRTADLVVYASDALSNIKPIRTMERSGPFAAYFDANIRRLRRALFNRQLSKHGLTHAQESLQIIAVGIGVYAAATYWHVSLPELVVTGIVFIQMIAIFSKLQGYRQQVAELEGSYWRIQELIDDVRANAEINTGTRTPSLDSEVRFEDVSFAHAETPVIHDASFTVPAGGITVLQGPSGAGKTTLIDLLTGLNRPDTGEVLIDGIPMRDIDIKQWRGMIGYVPQELSLLHGSIRQNITLGDADVPDSLIVDALKRADAWDFVQGLPDGLDSNVGEMGGRLSGGQRQRIALARGLLLRPKLLVLDEVTSALDPETEREICRMIEGLRGDYTIVAITHRPAWTDIATMLYKVEAGVVSRAELPDRNQPAA